MTKKELADMLNGVEVVPPNQGSLGGAGAEEWRDLK